MNMSDLSRRGFLSVLAVGGVLSLGFDTGCAGPGPGLIRHAERTGDFVPNAYVTIKRTGRIGLEVDKSEFGQGITTMYSTLVAEELDVPLESIDVHLADGLPAYRTNLNMQLTGGSASTKDGYVPIRQAAASARAMLVAAAASEWGVPPSECRTEAGQVFHAASGRSRGYGDLTVAAAHQQVPEHTKLKARSDFKVIGKRNTRIDGRSKVDGSARFGIDIAIPNMVRAYVIHGPVYGAQAETVRADRARSMPGVLDVFAFKGGVAVVAEKYWQARAAANNVEVAWSKGDVAGLDTEKLRSAARTRGHQINGDEVLAKGDAPSAIDDAAIKVDAFYEAPFLAHAPLEPQNCTVHVKDDGTVEVWAPCQSPSILQAYVADAIDVAESDVLVHVTLIGGAFGRRIVADYAAQAAQIAKRMKRPVQMIWSRESDMTQAFYRPQMAARLLGGLDAKGQIVGASAHVIGQPISLSFAPSLRGAMIGIPQAIQNVLVKALAGMFATDTVPDMFATEGIPQTLYDFRNFRVGLTPVNTKLPIAMFRSVGHSFTGFVMESFVDEMAHAAKVDPLEMRRRLLPAGSRSRRVLDAVADLSKWGSPIDPKFGRGIARHECFDTEVAEVAEVEIVNGRIKVRRVYVAVDCGSVVNPDIVKAQVEGAVIFGLSAALDQEITLVDGVVQQSNFDGYPLLRMFECPEIIVKILDSEEPPTGIGEPGLPPIGPAVANAIFHLTGLRLRKMPLQRSWNEAHK